MAPLWRTIRVFISSTFCDMQAEREELIKQIFPQLRKMCEQRRIFWSEVDLRWGITNEQRAEDKVLPICLEEIKHCTFFIGLLGERYGWVPEVISEEVIKHEPWLAAHRQKSITELEIIYGVLNNPVMANHAYFYFRDPAYAEKVPIEQRVELVERDAHAQHKLAVLKNRIRKSGVAIRENYADPETLGQMVLEDLTTVINQEFPPETVPDPLDQEANEHEAFAQSRASIYISRQEYFDYLDNHAASDGPPLVILGESGSGKSALLANWALRYSRSHTDELLIMHFIGASRHSADWSVMLRRIMGEFKRYFDIHQDIPVEPEELRIAFTNWLQMAASRGRAVLIIDGLNQLEDRDRAGDLVWLPPVIPASVRLIVSTLPGRPLEALQKRNWSSMQVSMLEIEERRQLIQKYLGQYRKTLDVGPLERIATAGQTANPLYLRALLEELRVVSEHEHLNDRINHYLDTVSVGSLYEKILERYEQDYEKERPGLVKDMMSLIWASRRGLSEAELLELLGENGGPLPRANFSPLYLASEQSLVTRSGLISFFHDYLRSAIECRYLHEEQDRRAAHKRLADYFETLATSGQRVDQLSERPNGAEKSKPVLIRLADYYRATKNRDQDQRTDQLSKQRTGSRDSQPTIISFTDYYKTVKNGTHEEKDSLSQSLSESEQTQLVLSPNQFESSEINHRVLEELPWQLSQARSWKRLYSLLANLPFFEACWETSQYDIRSYWATVEANSDLSMVDAYQPVVDFPERHTRYVWQIALLLLDNGYPSESFTLHRFLGELGGRIGDRDYLSACIGNQASILLRWGRLSESMELYKQQEQICRETNDKKGFVASLGNQAVILIRWGRLDEALELLRQQEHISRELGDKDGLQASLCNQAVLLRDQGYLESAMDLFKQQERICRELGNKDDLGLSLANQANILFRWGHLREALELDKQVECMCRELGDQRGLQNSLGDQAIILAKLGHFEEAMNLLEQVKVVFDELDDKEGLLASLSSQAGILYELGRREEAMVLLKKQADEMRELGDKEGLSSCLGHQATILATLGHFEDAMELFKEEEHICRELGNKVGLSINLCNQAGVLFEMDRLEDAMSLLKQQEAISRDVGDKDGLGASLGRQAAILIKWADLQQAMELLKQQERICRELDDRRELSLNLCNQGEVLQRYGSFEEAMDMYRQTEQICRESNLKKEIAMSLGYQAKLLAEEMTQPQEALPLAEEAYRIITEHGFAELDEYIKPILDSIRHKFT